jgi:hypothetical protein
MIMEREEQNILLYMKGRKDGERNALRQRWTCPVQPCWMADGLLREKPTITRP